MLTGRISSYSVANSVNEITHQYAPFSPGVQRFVHNNTGTFFADTWRVRSESDRELRPALGIRFAYA